MKNLENCLIGQRVVVRSYDAGVFVGIVEEIDLNSKIVKLSEACRIHYWNGAASLSQLAVEGVKKGNECRFPVIVEWELVFNVIEILPCSDAAWNNIREVKRWSVS